MNRIGRYYNVGNAIFLAMAVFTRPCLAAPDQAEVQSKVIPARQWHYTTARPEANWSSLVFNDSRWPVGMPGFGNQGLPPRQQALVKTTWNTPDIWARAEIELSDLALPLALRLSHDEDVEVFLNGILVCQRKGYIADYTIQRLDGAAASALRSGRNVLAAHCHQTVGGQFLDVQLVDLSTLLPRRRSIESILTELGLVPRPEHPRPDQFRER